MRVANWKAKEEFAAIIAQVRANADDFMDGVVADAKRRCPVGTITREGKWSSANVSFTPKTGENKGTLVQFHTGKRWMGRNPGDLRDSIRKVNKVGSGNIRVYAGNFKVYWAFMVERGTKYIPRQPFLRPAFFAAQNRALRQLKEGMA